MALEPEKLLVGMCQHVRHNRYHPCPWYEELAGENGYECNCCDDCTKECGDR